MLSTQRRLNFRNTLSNVQPNIIKKSLNDSPAKAGELSWRGQLPTWDALRQIESSPEECDIWKRWFIPRLPLARPKQRLKPQAWKLI